MINEEGGAQGENFSEKIGLKLVFLLLFLSEKLVFPITWASAEEARAGRVPWIFTQVITNVFFNKQ